MNLRTYFSKMKGGAESPPGLPFPEVLWSGLGAVIGVGLCAYISSRFLEPIGLTLIVGSLGASAVLVCGAIKSPLAQPRNVLGGHVISALVGVACYKMAGGPVWLAAGLGVSLSIMAMLVTQTLHPPGGATALTAVIGGERIHELGYLYALMPIAAGAATLILVALAINNLARNRRYPEFWL